MIDFFEVWIALGCAYVALWLFYISSHAANRLRRCVRIWLGISFAAVGVENFIDAAVAGGNVTPHVISLAFKTFCLTVTCAVISCLYVKARELPADTINYEEEGDGTTGRGADCQGS